jgi:spiro-SPASM protein
MVVTFALTTRSTWLREPLGNSSTLETIVAYLGQFENVDTVQLVSCEEIAGLPSGWKCIVEPVVTERALLSMIVSANQDEETLHVFSFLDQPFLNVELTRRMLDRHQLYRADYTFADGYPLGLAPEVLTGRVLSHLYELSKDEPMTRRGLFPVVQRDINRMDVETELSDVDNRLLRLELHSGTFRGLLMCQGLATDAPTAIDEWSDYANKTVVMQRTRPSFVSVQVIEQEVQENAYSPYPLMRTDARATGRVMETETFAKLIERLEAFAPEAVVHLSLWGEIGLHPHAIQLIQRVLDSRALTLVVETSGVGWSDQAMEALWQIDDRRFSLIVGLDTADPAVYARVRGEGFEQATRFASNAVFALKERAHVQAVRSEMTEPGLHAFYTEWKKKTDNVVIQKYDYFCGALPQRKIGDISPLHRFPCWHLQRDLNVLVDGSVPLCREDIHGSDALGNCIEESLEVVWERGASRFADHASDKYEGICGKCDEYYTFNF